MLPLLRILGDGQRHAIQTLVEQLANEFQLTDDERQQILPSGKVTTFRSRVGWAKTYLKKAELLENDTRGTYKITTRGLETLNNPPQQMTKY